MAVLPVMLLVGGLVIQTALSLGALAFLRINSGTSIRAAGDATLITQSAFQDAVLRIIRNNSYSSSGYTFTNAGVSASVVITRDQPVPGQTTIAASSTVLGRIKQVEGIVSINTNGEVRIVSFGEL